MQYRNYLKLLCLLFILPVQLFAQQASEEIDITGLWKGTLYNDTTHQTLKYEIAISEEKGKLTGYSSTVFVVNGKEYYGVKEIKVRKQDGKVVIEDAKLVGKNYPDDPPKGVRQLDVLTLQVKDSIMIMSGPFTTNRTKEFRSLTGNIVVQRKNDLYPSVLITHLKELGLAESLSFVQPKKEEVVVKAEPVKEESPVIAKTEKPKKEKAEKVKPAPEKKEVIVKAEPVKEAAPGITKTEKPKKEKAEKIKPVKEVQQPIAQAPPVILPPAADVNRRTIETIRSVEYKSDSLVITLYDNGEVDGDTVSVLMNGEVIMPRVGLSTRPVRKTIYITKDTPDSIRLIMYAENLGSIPPNTGLLVVHDGDDIYEIRFSGDYTKNAAIVFRRKKR